MKLNNHTILLVGGGTGGHAAPVLAVYQKLIEARPELKIFVAGVGSSEEKEFLKSIPRYLKISSGKLHRRLTWNNVPQLLKLSYGMAQAIFMLNKIKPRVVFSKGGFASLPIVNAARLLRIPYFVHESDIEMGRVNKTMAQKAKKVFICYPAGFYKQLPDDKKVFTGPILREGFLSSGSDKKLFGFNNNKPVIFLTGGSQGSLNLSRNFLEVVPELLLHFNVIHQAGRHSILVSKKFRDSLSSEARNDYYLTEFLRMADGKDYMLEAINLADLTISRAGSTIAELAVKGKAMLLIPWQHSAQNHQEENAKFFTKNGSAIMITEEELTPLKLKNRIFDLFADDKRMIELLGKKAKTVFPNNGLETIVNEILKELK